MRFLTYSEAIAYAEERKSIETRFEEFRALMEEIGNPQDGLTCIHVAGTNGKGSTCRFLYDILKTKYNTVALYTSPHLENPRDRIRINDEWIPEAKFLEYMNKYIDEIERYEVSFVAIFTLFFFLYCREKKPDIAVVEVSLGGRWDTTNVIREPLLSVITTIDFDHMNFFGNTLPEIAREKAGIIKPGCPVLLCNIREEAIGVLEQKAKEEHAPLYHVPEYEDRRGGIVLDGVFYDMHASSYQRMDACFALTAARLCGIDITTEAVREAVAHSFWPGRFETVKKEPLVILDGSHNEEGISALMKEMRDLPRPLIVVFTALADKRGPNMCALLLKEADELIVTEFTHARADTADHLVKQGCTVIRDYREAIAAAIAHAGNSGTVIITGSLYFISAVRSEFIKK